MNQKNLFEDTIIAISTPVGYGGLGIVRLTGKKALPAALKFFKAKKSGAAVPPCHAVLGNLYDTEHNEPFEEAYLTYFPAPHTYTREDLVEISCHGSPVILEEAVRLGIKAGARHARPGEFTLRAYLNGRIDMLQAESINDLIHASSIDHARISFRQLGGSLSRKVQDLRREIIHLLSQIEASIEFPEEELKVTSRIIEKTLRNAANQVKQLIASYDFGKSLSEGLTLALAGRTNVGKSTLFNALLQQQRAIVTPYPGTTRDYLREKIRIEGLLFTLVDMAGLSRAAHPIEKEGIRRGRRIAAEADGILLLFDASRPETPDDIALVKKFRNKNTILLFNKNDLPKKFDADKIKALDENHLSLDISALKGTNLDKLKEMICEHFVPTPGRNKEIILHLRQKLLFEQIFDALSAGFNVLRKGYPEEFYVEEIRRTLPLIRQLTGEIRTDDILEDIFGRFCVGK